MKAPKAVPLNPRVFTDAMPNLAWSVPEFWAKAAYRRAGSKGCCTAIGNGHALEFQVFERLFGPSSFHERKGFWWGHITPENQTARIIALQLAALLVAENNPAIHPL